MSNKKDRSVVINKLADHLAALDSQDGSTLSMESDMLSLIVSGTLKGEDISRRYPAFYQKLMENADLRQAFLDALESIEAERAGELVPMPETAKRNLDHLFSQAAGSTVETTEKENWRLTWQRSLEQIQAVFSPQELAYRADLNMIEDPWFTLLREETTVAGSTFAVVLECTLSNDRENALSTFLNLAITLGSSPEPVQFPLRASFSWGGYNESVLVMEEGRARFPDILLSDIFDPLQQHIQAGLNLTLETTL
jgi:hypothetical protein